MWRHHKLGGYWFPILAQGIQLRGEGQVSYINPSAQLRLILSTPKNEKQNWWDLNSECKVGLSATTNIVR